MSGSRLVGSARSCALVSRFATADASSIAKNGLPPETLVDAAEKRSRKNHVEPLMDQTVEFAERQRRDLDALDLLAELHVRRGLLTPAREQKGNRLRGQPADGKAQQERGFRVQPLDVVHTDKEDPC